MHSVAKKNKKLKGGPLGTLKNFRKKVAQCRKKSKGGPLASTGFVGYVKVKNERGTLWRQKKFRKKIAQCRKKIEKGGLFSPVRFCRLHGKSKKWKGDPLH